MKINRIHLYRKDISFYIFVILFLLSIFTGSGHYRIFSYSAELVSLLALWGFYLTKSKQKGFYPGYDKTLIILFVCQILFIWIAFFTYSHYPNKTLTFAMRHLLMLPFFFISMSDEYIGRLLTISKKYIMLSIVIYIALFPLLGNNGSIFGTYQYVATYSSILIVGILAKLFSYNRFNRSDYFWICISTLALFMTGKRSFVIIAVVISFLGTLLLKNNKKHKRVLRIVILGAILGGVLLLVKPDLLESVTRMKTLVDSDTTMSGRTKLWDLALYLWSTSPIYGIGYGTFSTFTSENMSYVYSTFGVQRTLAAHNIYMQLLAETGVLGIALFSTFFAVALYKTIKLLKMISSEDYRRKMLTTLSLFLQLWFLLYGLSGNDLYMPGQYGLYILALVLMWSQKNNIIYAHY